MKLRAGSLKINKPLASYQENNRAPRINKIKNEREVTTDAIETQRIIKRILCQQTGQPRRNGQTPRKIQPSETEQGKKQKI